MRKRDIAVLLGLCLLIGCNATTITTDQPAYGIPVDFTSNQFLWGLVGDTVQTSGYSSRAEVYKGFGNYIMTILTAGIYSPWTVKVWYTETKK